MTAKKVLVVDDTPGNRYAVSRMLRGAGMEVAEAEDGTSALRLVRDLPDLVVLDINLPDMTGYDVCRQIKANPATASIPVMHLSASYTASADRAYGLEAGADAYLTHPLDPAVFVATARALLRAAHAEAETRRSAAEWRTTFDAIADAIFVLGGDGTVQRCNAAAADLFHALPDDVAGRPWGLVVSQMALEPAERAQRVAVEPAQRFDVRGGARSFQLSTHRVPGEASGAPQLICVLADITQQQQAQRERELLLEHAEAARAEAERANRAKADFLAIMSHELRTPLNAIAGFTDLIALGVRGPVTDAQQSDLEKIRRSQITLMALINDLLSFAKLESGSVQYDLQTVRVGEALDAAGEFVESQVRERALALVVESCDRDIAVHADPDKLQQILLNLLSNAVKFTGAGGAIMLSCETDEGRVHVRVRDTGQGIPSDKLASIFDPFMQVDQRLARKHQGVGLGLAISRDLAVGMGGTLTVESEVGVGSTFTITLPIGVAPVTNTPEAA